MYKMWQEKPTAQSAIKISPGLMENVSVTDRKYTPVMAKTAPIA